MKTGSHSHPKEKHLDARSKQSRHCAGTGLNAHPGAAMFDVQTTHITQAQDLRAFVWFPMFAVSSRSNQASFQARPLHVGDSLHMGSQAQ